MITNLNIRPAVPDDSDDIWSILEPVIRGGETYALDRDMNRVDALGYWMGADQDVFVAESGGYIVGTYYLRTNQRGGGSHICNCGYMVAQEAAGRGVARRMCEDSIVRAREAGYLGMQFNFVVSNNQRAVALWQSCGFAIVGCLPGAFRHPNAGFVDALVMFRSISAPVPSRRGCVSEAE